MYKDLIFAILLLLPVLFFAVRGIYIKKKKKGSLLACGGDCSNCPSKKNASSLCVKSELASCKDEEEDFLIHNS